MSAAQNALSYLLLGVEIAQLQEQEQLDMASMLNALSDDGEAGPRRSTRKRKSAEILSKDQVTSSPPPRAAKRAKPQPSNPPSTRSKDQKKSSSIFSAVDHTKSRDPAAVIDQDQTEQDSPNIRELRKRNTLSKPKQHNELDEPPAPKPTTKPKEVQTRKKKVAFVEERGGPVERIGKRPKGMPLREWKIKWLKGRATHWR